MERFKIESIGSSTYITYTLFPDEEMDRIGLGMLKNNRIYGLLPMHMLRINEKLTLKYEISGMTSFVDYLSDCADSSIVTLFLKSLGETLDHAQEYMLDETSFVFDKRYIYLDQKQHSQLLYLPVKGKQEVSFQEFCGSLMDDPAVFGTLDGNVFLQIKKYLCDRKFSPKGLAQLLEELELRSAIHQSEMSKNAPPQKVVLDVEQRVQVSADKLESHDPADPIVSSTETTPMSQRSKEKDQEADKRDEEVTGRLFSKERSKSTGTVFLPQTDEKSNQMRGGSGSIVLGRADPQGVSGPGSTVFMVRERESDEKSKDRDPIILGRKRPAGSDCAHETVWLPTKTQEQQQTEEEEDATAYLVCGYARGYLVRESTHEKIEINKSEFRIGKSRREVDYRVENNSAVSRYHAKILQHGDSFWIVDTNSKNRTYINQRAIESEREVPLSDGTKIRLADEDFVFFIEK